MTTRSINRNDNYSAIGWLIVGTGGDVGFADSDINFESLKPNHLPPRGIIICSTGDLKVTSLDGTVDTFSNGELAVGVIHAISVKRLWTTGTTVTKVRILW